MTHKLRLAGILALVLAGAGVYWLLAGAGDGRTPRYLVQPVTRGSIVASVSANGTLNPVTLVNVGTQVSGTVKQLRADFNDHVKAGQVLAELDPALLQAQLQQSEAGLAAARASLALAVANERRARPMRDLGYLTAAQYDQTVEALNAARAERATAEAKLRHDRTNLAYSVIRSPVDGVVVNRAVDLGQTVAASFQTPTLFQIAQDLRRMQIDTSFAEADIGGIRAGQPVRFTVDAFPDRSYEARVRQVRLNPTTVQNVVSYDVVVAVDNDDETLMPGMTAYVKVILDQHADALLVPNAALRFTPDGAPAPASAGMATVYLRDGDGLRAVPLRAGLADGRNTEVLGDALKPGDEVVTGKVADRAAPAAPANPIRFRAF